MASTEILLESGTNELEVLVLSLTGQRYGVNVAKVREVIEPVATARLPETHVAVDGVFQLRERVIPLVNLKRALDLTDLDAPDGGKIIVMEFDDTRVAFLVDSVEQIYRVNWEDVSAAPDVSGVSNAPLTAVAFINEAMIPMLDFERLVFEIAGVDLFNDTNEATDEEAHRGGVRILLAEDSHVMRMLIEKTLAKAGYSNVMLCHHGKEAWDTLGESVQSGGACPYDLIITNIEMPQIDGLHLTKRIREHAQLKHLPIIIFSSIVSVDNEKKCQSVGADAQITKPQLNELVALVDKLMDEVRSGTRTGFKGAMSAEPVGVGA